MTFVSVPWGLTLVIFLLGVACGVLFDVWLTDCEKKNKKIA